MKKHVKLYNRMFQALHEDDKFVLCLDKTHEEVIALMAKAMADVSIAGSPTFGELAAAALTALQYEATACAETVPASELDNYVAGVSRSHEAAMCHCLGPELTLEKFREIQRAAK